MNVGDMVQHYVWDNDVYVITNLNKRDPYTNVFAIELQFVFHKNDKNINSSSSPSAAYLKEKRYIVKRILEKEWEHVSAS